ncbi:hypothetical protein FOCC_FOCC002585, partial [Frankliniella occidentalis]
MACAELDRVHRAAQPGEVLATALPPHPPCSLPSPTNGLPGVINEWLDQTRVRGRPMTPGHEGCTLPRPHIRNAPGHAPIPPRAPPPRPPWGVPAGPAQPGAQPPVLSGCGSLLSTDKQQ